MSEDSIEKVDVCNNLEVVNSKIAEAVARRSKDLTEITPRLVAVSKIKPAALVVAAYKAGQIHFGENYSTELVEKAHDPQILEQCNDIKWHLIGHLQTNKITKVVAVPGLFMIETVDSIKLANKLNKSWVKYRKTENALNVMVQVNTSGESAKSGVQSSEVVDIVGHIINNCLHLKFVGLMTIGEYGYDPTKGPNPDFLLLYKSRQEVCEQLKLEVNDVELSMGMSTDFEQAIEMGATNVRVGTSIFGPRLPKHLWKHEKLEPQPCFESNK